MSDGGAAPSAETMATPLPRYRAAPSRPLAVLPHSANGGVRVRPTIARHQLQAPAELHVRALAGEPLPPEVALGGGLDRGEFRPVDVVDANRHPVQVPRQLRARGGAGVEAGARAPVLADRAAVLGHVGDQDQASIVGRRPEVGGVDGAVHRLDDRRAWGARHVVQPVQVAVQGVADGAPERRLDHVRVRGDAHHLGAPAQAAAGEAVPGVVRVSPDAAHGQLAIGAQALVLAEDQRLDVGDLVGGERVSLVHQHHRVLARDRLAGDAAGVRVGRRAAIERQQHADAHDGGGRGAQDRHRPPGLLLAPDLGRAKPPLAAARDAAAVTDHRHAPAARRRRGRRSPSRPSAGPAPEGEYRGSRHLDALPQGELSRSD